MKKLFSAFCVALLLFGCSKGKDELEVALVAKFKDDQDLKDYHLDPKNIADCVIEQIADALPGFPGDPRRNRFFEAHAHFINASNPGDAEKAVTDYQELFGSADKAREAAMNITTHIMTCMSIAMEAGDAEQGQQ
jgi:hypothetical protein